MPYLVILPPQRGWDVAGQILATASSLCLVCSWWPKGWQCSNSQSEPGVLFLQVMEKVGMSWNLPVKPSKLDGVGYALAISSSLLHQEKGKKEHIQSVCMPQRNSQKVYLSTYLGLSSRVGEWAHHKSHKNRINPHLSIDIQVARHVAGWRHSHELTTTPRPSCGSRAHHIPALGAGSHGYLGGSHNG